MKKAPIGALFLEIYLLNCPSLYMLSVENITIRKIKKSDTVYFFIYC